MRIPRFYIDKKLDRDILEIKKDEIFHRIKNVLRKQKENNIKLFNGDGYDYCFRILKFEKNKVFLKFTNKEKVKRLYYVKLNIYASLIKMQRFKILLEKITELGAYSLTPIFCNRTVIKNFKPKLRYFNIIKEASEQSLRESLLILNKPLKFKTAILKSKNQKNSLNILFDIRGIDYKNMRKNLDFKKIKYCNLFFGPEGGFEYKELDFAKNNGFYLARISNLNLRTETAVILGTGLIAEELI